MNDNDGNPMVNRAMVEEMLRQQAETLELRFNLKLDAELSQQAETLEAKFNLRLQSELQAVKDKHAEVTHHLEMARRDSDAVKRQQLTDQKALASNIQRIECVKQNTQTLGATISELKGTTDKDISSLKSQVASQALEMDRLYDTLLNTPGTPALALLEIRSQHDRVRALIAELDKQLAETHVRHVSEGSMACNCSHKTINEKIDRLRHRFSDVRGKSALHFNS
jgi:chromosome segregation ATPase